jgi:chromosome segregation ATPase
MEEILHKLHSVSKKVEKLEKKFHRLKQDRDQLHDTLQEAKTLLGEKARALVELEERYEAAKVVNSLGNKGDYKEIQAKIDNYLKEIDICLSILGDQK